MAREVAMIESKIKNKLSLRDRCFIAMSEALKICGKETGRDLTATEIQLTREVYEVLKAAKSDELSAVLLMVIIRSAIQLDLQNSDDYSITRSVIH